MFNLARRVIGEVIHRTPALNRLVVSSQNNLENIRNFGILSNGHLTGRLDMPTTTTGVSPANAALLQPSLTPLWTFVNGFKIKNKLRKRCKDCYMVVRQERIYVLCKTHPRHKQMSMKKKEKNTWILTDATQSKVRQW